jgi:O-antigen/teichoic acid export membrane protein
VAWAEGLFFLPNALTTVQRPDVVRASGKGARRQAATVFRVATLVTVVLVIVLVVIAPFLCVTIFGAGFRGSIVQLRLLALGAFGIAALKLLGNTLTAQRKPMLETAAVGVAFIFTVVLDALLIPAYGGRGAAIASTVSYSAGGVAVAIIFTRVLSGRLVDLVPRGSELGWLWRRLRAPREAARVGK